MSANFAELLSINTADIKKPIPLPNGHYSLIVKSFETCESSQKKTPGIRVELGVIGFGPDVDQAALNGVDLSKKTLREEFWLTPDAMFRLVEFLKTLGIETEGQSLRDLLPQMQGRTISATIIQVPSQRPGDDSVYNNILGFQAA